MIKTFQYRIYPTDKQIHELTIQFGINRYVWNEALHHIKTNLNNKFPGKSTLEKRLVQIKKNEDTQWIKQANSQSLQKTVKRLAKSFDNFFKKIGKYPKFKKRKDIQSIEIPQRFSLELCLNKRKALLKIPKIGYLDLRYHRPIEGNIRTVLISKTPSGEYYASLVCDNNFDSKLSTGVNNPVNWEGEITGIDLGLKDVIIDSDGNKYDNKRFMKQEHRKMRVLQRKFARQSLNKRKKVIKHGKNKRKVLVYSNRCEVTLKQIQKLHKHIANKRKDYNHKISRKIADENQAVAFEDLNIRGLMKNKKLSRSFADVGLSQIVSFTKYKMLEQGKPVFVISRFYPSSKLCSCCGKKKNDLKLSDRTWTCDNCGVKHDRDINAGKNIKMAGQAMRDEFMSIMNSGILSTEVRDNVLDFVRLKEIRDKSQMPESVTRKTQAEDLAHGQVRCSVL